MLTAIRTQAEVKSGSVIEVQAPGVPTGTTVEVIILIAQARPDQSATPVITDRARAFERAKGLLRVRNQAPDDAAIQELLEQDLLEKHADSAW